ncbi:MAG TPA: DciA family protein [Alphaproteobacteria bacterium]|nr:DciA family protein [Alphaproteobacteria bacterium]
MKEAPTHLSGTLHELAEKILGQEWRALSLLLKNWPGIVGAKLAQDSAPSSLRYVSRGGSQQARIVVKIPGALAPSFQMQEETMRARINRLMGYDFVEKIIFEHHIKM